jgi:hypothetical protein
MISVRIEEMAMRIWTDARRLKVANDNFHHDCTIRAMSMDGRVSDNVPVQCVTKVQSGESVEWASRGGALFFSTLHHRKTSRIGQGNVKDYT